MRVQQGFWTMLQGRERRWDELTLLPVVFFSIFLPPTPSPGLHYPRRPLH